MLGSSPEAAQRVRLVTQHLYENEVLDGVFEVDLERVVAVTSERIVIVNGGGARGWGLTGIPWWLVTGVELKAGELGRGLTVEVNYTVHTHRLVRNGEVTEIDRTTQFCPGLAGDAEEMIRLMSARRECA